MEEDKDTSKTMNHYVIKSIKVVIASYIIAIVVTASASFLTLAAGMTIYSNHIDNNAQVVTLLMAIILAPLISKHLK